MTDAQRREAIEKLIADYTSTHTTSKAAAREALVSEGIYTRKGQLRVEFGGEPKKARNAA